MIRYAAGPQAYVELLGTTRSGTKDDAIPITITVPQQLYLLVRPQLANGEAKVGHHHSLRLQPAIVIRAFAVLLLSELPLLELFAAKRLHKQGALRALHRKSRKL